MEVYLKSCRKRVFQRVHAGQHNLSSRPLFSKDCQRTETPNRELLLWPKQLKWHKITGRCISGMALVSINERAGEVSAQLYNDDYQEAGAR
jgi:hypothetical protein